MPVRFFPCAPSRGSLRLDDLFGKQGIGLSASLGNGSASDFRWRNGKIDVSGTLKRLQASVALQGKTSADIKLALDIAGQKAQVERLTFTDRRKRTLVGVRLNRPSTLPSATVCPWTTSICPCCRRAR